MRLNNADILAMSIGGEDYTSIKQFANALLASNNLVADVYIDGYLLFSCRVHAYVDHDYITIPVDGRFALKNSYIANTLTIKIKEFGSNTHILETHTLTNVLFGTCDYDADLSFKVLNVAPYSISKGWVQDSEFHPLFSHKMNKINIESQPSINDGIDVEPGGGGPGDDTGGSGETGGDETGVNRTISWQSDDRIKSIKFIANNEELPINGNSITVNSNTGTVRMIIEPKSGLSIGTVEMRYGGSSYNIPQGEMSADGYSFELPINADVDQDAAPIEIIITFSGGIDVSLPNASHADVQGVTNSPIAPNSSFTFRAIPDEGYKISSVTVNGDPIESNSNDEYTIQNVTSSPEISVISSVDTNKFYSAKQKGYIISTQESLEPLEGYFKVDLENIENQNDREDLSKILPQLKILVDNFLYGGDGDASMIIVDSNLDSVCESLSSELHTRDWVLRPYYGDSGRDRNIIYMYNDPDNKYPIMFCSNKINYDTSGLLFFDNSHIDFIKDTAEIGRYDSSTGYVYDKNNTGDINDADLNYNIIEITFSNMSDAISNPNIIYSNGIRVFDRDNVMHFGRYKLDLSESNQEEVEFIKSKLNGVKIVIDQYYYSGSLGSKAVPQYSISNISSSDITAVFNYDMSLSLYIDSSTESKLAYMYVDDAQVGDWNTYSLYHVNDSDKPLESVGWSGGSNSYSNNGYVFDRSNSDLLTTGKSLEECDIRYIRTFGTPSDIDHNDGEGQSAVTIMFNV